VHVGLEVNLNLLAAVRTHHREQGFHLSARLYMCPAPVQQSGVDECRIGRQQRVLNGGEGEGDFLGIVGPDPRPSGGAVARSPLSSVD
jgi:hypothetical protein